MKKYGLNLSDIIRFSSVSHRTKPQRYPLVANSKAIKHNVQLSSKKLPMAVDLRDNHVIFNSPTVRAERCIVLGNPFFQKVEGGRVL